MIKPKFNPTVALLSTLTMAAGSVNVYAQDEPILEEVVVQGFRSVIQQSQAIKREATSVTEAITAEDIGKLPDTSIAESLARLPGLAGERRNGRTSGLSVRGFNENYVGTTLNGRELLGMGDNRGVEYDLYPAEIISEVVVYKTPDATLMTQGVGGTVDMRTLRPLDRERIIAFNASYEQNGMESGNPDFDDTGHRVAFTYSDQFADDTLGLSISLASMESPSQEEQFRGWGYANVSGNATLADGISTSDGDVVLGGHDSFVRSAVMKRDSVAGVLQWEPSEKLSVTVDALYIDFQEDKVFRGLEEGGAEWGTPNYTVTGLEEGLVTSGYWEGFYSVIRNDAERKDAELTTLGVNVSYNISDDWSLNFDASTGDVTKTITNIESYSGVGRAQSATQGAATSRAWMMTDIGVMYSAHPSIPAPDLADPNLVRLAGPQAWGGSLAPVADYQASDGQPLGYTTAQDGFVNNPDFDESLDSFRFALNGDVDWGFISGLEVGFNYSDRSKTKINRGAYLTAPTWPADGPIPDEYYVGSADLSFIGVGDIVAYDSLGLYQSGFYAETAAEDLETGRKGDTYTVNEEITTLYAMADLAADFGAVEMTGNLGLQYVDTEQNATGFGSYTGPDLYVLATPVEGGDSYDKLLPSMNLNFAFAEDHTVRLAASKTISRPRMDDMRPNTTVSFSFNDAQVLEQSDIDNSPWSGSAGNPQLRPLEANQYDVSYEWYYAADGMLSVAYFYKDLVNWHREGETVQDFTPYYIPGYHQSSGANGTQVVPPYLFEGIVSNREDGLTGFAKGYEVQASVPFHLISESLDGFGILASATFTDGELDDESQVPGLSDEIYTLTAYFERGGFEFRVSGRKRSEYLSETRGISLSLVDTVDQGSELWDAQIGYNFSESGIDALQGLSITLQAQNLTDEDTVQFDEEDPRQITQYQTFGANYLLGVNYKF
ncbi:TonB-dependent receptor [Gilvimarinus sp. SDUM040013]|uniref:TonB-dependent receptor n=1 Tax=Gilvimarinus gilvus TaxID=3058038 RepID=A0ABU4S1R2_9GAMM|nr:TonB-dependent receptor [Gilvimarinus sp. SDUM040013]MDO3384446.1 TonB-dependent receptor [Gilvimarinus sp. SDUM040013]MDX6851085.1 TonB-dependent receptor [Gilvimarinus sp. SDUM040013]